MQSVPSESNRFNYKFYMRVVFLDQGRNKVFEFPSSLGFLSNFIKILTKISKAKLPTEAGGGFKKN